MLRMFRNNLVNTSVPDWPSVWIWSATSKRIRCLVIHHRPAIVWSASIRSPVGPGRGAEFNFASLLSTNGQYNARSSILNRSRWRPNPICDHFLDH